MSYEKVSININDENLSQIDLLIENDFYSNRSDFINSAIETLLREKKPIVKKLIACYSGEDISENSWFVGVVNYNLEFLEKVKKADKHLSIKGFGVLSIDKNVSLELVKETIKFVSPKIKIHASEEIKKYIIEESKKNTNL